MVLYVEKINKQDFSLDDVYAFTETLKAKHPANHNVHVKVRQQLQFLRDKGVVRFWGGVNTERN